MNYQEVEKNDVKRLEIAGLYTLSFLGYMMHSILSNMLAQGKDPGVLAETAKMIQLPSTQIMIFVFAVLTIAPAFMAYLFKGKSYWRILTILAFVLMILNGMHSVDHMLHGDVVNGVTTFVLQMVPGVTAVIWSFKFLKTFKD